MVKPAGAVMRALARGVAEAVQLGHARLRSGQVEPARRAAQQALEAVPSQALELLARVELARGVWTGSGFAQSLKLINIPVLKHHDEGGSEITAGLKHFYGLLSMSDGMSAKMHWRRNRAPMFAPNSRMRVFP